MLHQSLFNSHEVRNSTPRLSQPSEVGPKSIEKYDLKKMRPLTEKRLTNNSSESKGDIEHAGLEVVLNAEERTLTVTKKRSPQIYCDTDTEILDCPERATQHNGNVTSVSDFVSDINITNGNKTLPPDFHVKNIEFSKVNGIEKAQFGSRQVDSRSADSLDVKLDDLAQQEELLWQRILELKSLRENVTGDRIPTPKHLQNDENWNSKSIPSLNTPSLTIDSNGLTQGQHEHLHKNASKDNIKVNNKLLTDLQKRPRYFDSSDSESDYQDYVHILRTNQGLNTENKQAQHIQTNTSFPSRTSNAENTSSPANSVDHQSSDESDYCELDATKPVFKTENVNKSISKSKYTSGSDSEEDYCELVETPCQQTLHSSVAPTQNTSPSKGGGSKNVFQQSFSNSCKDGTVLPGAVLKTARSQKSDLGKAPTLASSDAKDANDSAAIQQNNRDIRILIAAQDSEDYADIDDIDQFAPIDTYSASFDEIMDEMENSGDCDYATLNMYSLKRKKREREQKETENTCAAAETATEQSTEKVRNELVKEQNDTGVKRAEGPTCTTEQNDTELKRQSHISQISESDLEFLSVDRDTGVISFRTNSPSFDPDNPKRHSTPKVCKSKNKNEQCKGKKCVKGKTEIGNAQKCQQIESDGRQQKKHVIEHVENEIGYDHNEHSQDANICTEEKLASFIREHLTGDISESNNGISVDESSEIKPSDQELGQGHNDNNLKKTPEPTPLTTSNVTLHDQIWSKELGNANTQKVKTVLSPPLKKLNATLQDELWNSNIDFLNSISDTETESLGSQDTMLLMTTEETKRTRKHIEESFRSFQLKQERSLKENINQTTTACDQRTTSTETHLHSENNANNLSYQQNNASFSENNNAKSESNIRPVSTNFSSSPVPSEQQRYTLARKQQVLKTHLGYVTRPKLPSFKKMNDDLRLARLKSNETLTNTSENQRVNAIKDKIENQIPAYLTMLKAGTRTSNDQINKSASDVLHAARARDNNYNQQKKITTGASENTSIVLGHSGKMVNQKGDDQVEASLGKAKEESNSESYTSIRDNGTQSMREESKHGDCVEGIERLSVSSDKNDGAKCTQLKIQISGTTSSPEASPECPTSPTVQLNSVLDMMVKQLKQLSNADGVDEDYIESNAKQNYSNRYTLRSPPCRRAKSMELKSKQDPVLAMFDNALNLELQRSNASTNATKPPVARSISSPASRTSPPRENDFRQLSDSNSGSDELEQFVQQDSDRIEKIRSRHRGNSDYANYAEIDEVLKQIGIIGDELPPKHPARERSKSCGGPRQNTELRRSKSSVSDHHSLRVNQRRSGNNTSNYASHGNLSTTNDSDKTKRRPVHGSEPNVSVARYSQQKMSSDDSKNSDSEKLSASGSLKGSRLSIQAKAFTSRCMKLLQRTKSKKAQTMARIKPWRKEQESDYVIIPAKLASSTPDIPSSYRVPESYQEGPWETSQQNKMEMPVSSGDTRFQWKRSLSVSSKDHVALKPTLRTKPASVGTYIQVCMTGTDQSKNTPNSIQNEAPPDEQVPPTNERPPPDGASDSPRQSVADNDDQNSQKTQNGGLRPKSCYV